MARPLGSSSRLRNTGTTSMSTHERRLDELLRARDAVAVSVEHERRSVEDQLVLATDLVDVDERAGRVRPPEWRASARVRVSRST